MFVVESLNVMSAAGLKTNFFTLHKEDIYAVLLIGIYSFISSISI